MSAPESATARVDAQYAALRAARFALLEAIGVDGVKLAPVALPPWSTARGTVAASAYSALDHLDGLACVSVRDSATASEFEECLCGALPMLAPATISAAFAYLEARRKLHR